MSEGALARYAQITLAVIAVGAALFWLQAILTPLAVAIFLAVMVDGLARELTERLRAPRWAAMPAAIALLVLGVGLVLIIVADNSVGFATQLVSEAPRLNTVIASIAAQFGVKVPPTVQGVIDQVNPGRYLGALVGALQSFGAAALYSLIYLGFLIASRQGFRRKARALFPDEGERRAAGQVFDRIRNGVESYLWIQTVTGAAMAVLSGLAMALLGLHNAVFWAFLIFIASYVPILGGLVGSCLPPLFALLQFEAYWRAILLLAMLQVIFFVVGSVVQPRMQRDNLNIDPVVVLLSLAFWGVVWGVAGMFLSTPLTVMATIILAQFPGSRWIAILLSGDGDPAPKAAPAGPAPAPRPALLAGSVAEVTVS